MKLASLMPNYLVVDSSVLIFYDRKGKLEGFLQQKKKEKYSVIIPNAVAQEVRDEPKEFAEEIKQTHPETANLILNSVERINRAIEQNLMQVVVVNYRKYSKELDNIRKHLSILDAKAEFAVKKGDPELIVLVIQLYDEVKQKVFVTTYDKGLLKTLKHFSEKVEFEVI